MTEYRITWDSVRRHETILRADNPADAKAKVEKMLEAGTDDQSPFTEIIDVVEWREPWAA